MCTDIWWLLRFSRLGLDVITIIKKAPESPIGDLVPEK
jgi:hypothetical protein